MDELQKKHAAWCKSLERAVEADSWGQVLEAVEAYERLATRLVQALSECHQLTKPQRETIGNVVKALELRAKGQSSVDDRDHATPTKEDMEEILDVLHSVLSSEPHVFPLNLIHGAGASSSSRPAKKASTVQVVDEDNDDEMFMAASESKPALVRQPGSTYVDIILEKIGLKDANVYVNPTLSVSVLDSTGIAIEDKHDTTVGACSEPKYVTFNNKIHLRTSLGDLESRGASIFFEFIHYKAKKRKQSCRCWALLEMDEITKSGPLVLELYQKPMDPKKKRINLFTVKPLYLHIELQLQTI